MPALRIKTINLEEGRPTVDQARQRMLKEIEVARREGCDGVRLIHGYGSSGVGGGIRLAVGRALQEMKKHGKLATVIYGEEWRISHAETWALVRKHPELKQDPDLGRKNRGITLVFF